MFKSGLDINTTGCYLPKCPNMNWWALICTWIHCYNSPPGVLELLWLSHFSNCWLCKKINCAFGQQVDNRYEVIGLQPSMVSTLVAGIGISMFLVPPLILDVIFFVRDHFVINIIFKTLLVNGHFSHFEKLIWIHFVHFIVLITLASFGHFGRFGHFDVYLFW